MHIISMRCSIQWRELRSALLYQEVRDGKPSKCHHNIRMLIIKLAQRGIEEMLETNVIFCSTPMSRNLAKTMHGGQY